MKGSWTLTADIDILSHRVSAELIGFTPKFNGNTDDRGIMDVLSRLTIKGGRMKFIYLVGVEGSGHSMMRDVLFTNLTNAFGDRIEDLGYRDLGGDRLKRILEKPRPDDSVLFSTSSFPTMQPRDSLRRGDLIDVVNTVKEVARVRLLVVYRDPIRATFSALRRGFTDDIYLQCKIVEDNLIYITSQLATFADDDLYRILFFEEFTQDPAPFIDPLSHWLSIDKRFFNVGNIKRPSARIPEEIQNILRGFFSPQRVSQWFDFLSGSEYNLSNRIH